MVISSKKIVCDFIAVKNIVLLSFIASSLLGLGYTILEREEASPGKESAV